MVARCRSSACSSLPCILVEDGLVTDKLILAGTILECAQEGFQCWVTEGLGDPKLMRFPQWTLVFGDPMFFNGENVWLQVPNAMDVTNSLVEGNQGGSAGLAGRI